MKQVEQNYRSGRLRVADVPVPRAGNGQLLVVTHASLISSGTERQLLDLAKASLAGKAMARPDLVRRVVREARRSGIRPTMQKVFDKLDTPIALGYSLAGQIVEIGRGVEGFAVGDRIACAGAGFANHAEFNAVPKNLCARIPDGVSDEEASFAAVGAIALQGVRLAETTLGERVVVMGLGLIGLLTVQLLKASGCRVLGFDPDAARADLARQMGADIAVSADLEQAVEAFTERQGADAVLLTASTKSSEPLNRAAEISRLKGRIVVVGLVGMTIDREPFYKRELELKLSLSYGPGRHDPSYELAGHDYPFAYVRWTEQRNMDAFLALVAEGKVTPSALVTHRFDLADAERAYGVMERNEPHLAMLLQVAPQSTETALSSAASQRLMTPKPSAGTRTEAHGDPLAIGFVGLGNYAGSVLLPALRKVDGVVLKRAATATALSAGHAGARHGFESIATDPDAVIAADDIGTVFVATRHDSHARYAAAALDNGKNVFCEKPLALTQDDLDRVRSSADRSEGLLCVGFNRRFSPVVLQAQEALKQRHGPLVMLYRINAGAIPADSWIQREEGGGRIVGEICHFVDTMIVLCGALPTEVSAVAARDHPDAVSVLIRFADGSTGTIVYSSLGDPSVAKEMIEIFTAGQIVRIDDFTSVAISTNGKTRRRTMRQDKGQAGLVAAFLAACRGEADLPMRLAELRAVTEATFAIEDALRTGSVVVLEGASGVHRDSVTPPDHSSPQDLADR